MLDQDKISNIVSLETSTVYRFRFLNANYFSGSSIEYVFHYGDCTSHGPIINFTLIGADSSLFRKGMNNQQSFMISNGERVELLIVLSKVVCYRTVSVCGNSQQKFGGGHSNMESKKPLSGPNSIYNIKNIKLESKSNSAFS